MFFFACVVFFLCVSDNFHNQKPTDATKESVSGDASANADLTRTL